MHGPYKKIPFIEYQGETIGDSELILQRLIKDYNIDLGLTAPQLAQGRAWQLLIEQHLYWIIVYNRWVPEDSWKKLENAFFSCLKWPLRPIIAKQSRTSITRRWKLHSVRLFKSFNLYWTFKNVLN